MAGKCVAYAVHLFRFHRTDDDLDAFLADLSDLTLEDCAEDIVTVTPPPEQASEQSRVGWRFESVRPRPGGQ